MGRRPGKSAHYVAEEPNIRNHLKLHTIIPDPVLASRYSLLAQHGLAKQPLIAVNETAASNRT